LVYDSIARRPLAHAAVVVTSVRDTTLVRTAMSDTAGRFALDDVPAGPWVVTARHARLDSLALRELVAPIDIVANRAQRLVLAIPSTGALTRRVCPAVPASAERSGYLRGRLRRVGQPDSVVRGTVQVQWMEFSLRGRSPVRELVSIDVPAQDDGSYLACGVPVNGVLRLQAYTAQDTIGPVELTTDDHGLTYRDLAFGVSRAVTVRESAATDDSLAQSPRTVRRGAGRLTGVVRDARAQPLSGALVSVVAAGVESRTDASGRFLLADLPTGTQRVDVRAVGYDPAQALVDLTDPSNAEAGREVAYVLHAANATATALDTLRIRARLLGAAGRVLSEFDTRRRTGMGHFLGPDQLDRLNLVRVTDVVDRAPGIMRDPTGRPTMRASVGRCYPTIFLDGVIMPARASLDSFVPVADLLAVEIYTTSTATPSRFARAGRDCGAILLWTGERPAATPP
jgi:hypothetical protein